jgi:hypothetical protein
MIYDLTGKVIKGNVRIFIRPEFGVRLKDKDGVFQHTTRGPHDVPIEVAAHLLDDNKAFIVNENDEPIAPDGTVVGPFPEEEEE